MYQMLYSDDNYDERHQMKHSEHKLRPPKFIKFKTNQKKTELNATKVFFVGISYSPRLEGYLCIAFIFCLTLCLTVKLIK